MSFFKTLELADGMPSVYKCKSTGRWQLRGWQQFKVFGFEDTSMFLMLRVSNRPEKGIFACEGKAMPVLCFLHLLLNISGMHYINCLNFLLYI